MITTAPARSNQACRRCYNRKKKCSRTLPRCQACEHSGVQCSFEEQQEETGLFYISYVRGLEQRVAELEAHVRTVSSASPQASVTTPSDSTVSNPLEYGRRWSTTNIPQVVAASSTGSDQGSKRSITEERGDHLASELKQLSLEATADRYLGSSSGVSFARLTQAVLRRLKPDQYPFSFEIPSQDDVSAHSKVLEVNPSSATEGVDRDTPVLQYPSSLPNKDQAFRLAEYYWSHSHTLYPFVRKVWFMERLKLIYSGENHDLFQCSSWLYTMWMVFAIGSTTFSAIMPEGSEHESVQYFSNAMLYFNSALSNGNIAALDALLLQISYSFFNRVGSNTWYLVGSAVRLAVGMGLHTAPNEATQQLTLDVQEYRKRLFWCLYMMDRVVSISLGRPFGIRDDDIEIEPFADVDDENILPDRILLQPSLKASEMAVPLHILALRRIAGQIFDQVYSNRNKHLSLTVRDDILKDLHAKLVEWRRNMPFPLPQVRLLQVPHTSTAWYDLNYYTHVIMLYRPSPLCPVLTLEKVTLLAEASAMAIRQIAIMHRDQRYAFNWLNLFTVFTITLTLIYSITAQPEALSAYLQRSDALADLETASSILKNFGQKFPPALKCRNIVQDVGQRLSSHVAPRSPTAPSVDSRHPSQAAPELSIFSFTSPKDTKPSPNGFHEDETSYPSFPTGNSSYDELQHRVTSFRCSPEASSVVGDSNNTASTTSDSGLPPDFHLAATTTPFGDAAAQFMAAGIGTGTETDMDLDDEFMNFLGGNFES